MAEHARLLIVDDEAEIADMLAEFFTMRGYRVVTASDGPAALAAASDASSRGGIDLVLLDVNMPGMDGFSVCRRLRDHLSCPIIFLTARIEDVDQIDGFAAGADDYVLKPFSLEVLGGRVAAHLARESRSRGQEGQSSRFFRELTVDYGRRTVEVSAHAGAPAGQDANAAEKPVPDGSDLRPDGAPSPVLVDLTRIEFDILALLSKSPGRVFDRDLIYERVWDWDADGDPAIVREHIRRIRKKLALAGVAGECIETVWGVGYKWVAR